MSLNNHFFYKMIMKFFLKYKIENKISKLNSIHSSINLYKHKNKIIWINYLIIKIFKNLKKNLGILKHNNIYFTQLAL
jgi:hypothetical protein